MCPHAPFGDLKLYQDFRGSHVWLIHLRFHGFWHSFISSKIDAMTHHFMANNRRTDS